jgi:hypothetical protein
MLLLLSGNLGLNPLLLDDEIVDVLLLGVLIDFPQSFLLVKLYKSDKISDFAGSQQF